MPSFSQLHVEEILKEWAQAMSLMGTWKNPHTRKIFIHGKNLRDGVPISVN